MTTYITRGCYSESAIKGLVATPEDREQAVRALLEGVGAKLLAYYVTLGEFDFMIIAEGDNLEDLLAGLMVAGASGGVANLQTTIAVSPADAKVAMEKANKVSSVFRAAGAG